MSDIWYKKIQDEALRSTFGNRLRQILDERGIDPKDLEDAGVISAQSVNDYISKNALPSLRSAVRIASYLRISLDWLCEGYKADDYYEPTLIERSALDDKAPWL